MDKPAFYGWYHILWLCATVIACALIFAFRKRISQKAVDVTLIVWGSIMIFLELCKQIIVCFHAVGDAAVWSYEWSSFPFQFCSCPLFVALPAGLWKKGKIKDMLLSFLAAFAIIGGGVAMLCPAGMFTSSVFLNLHTMIWHSSMVAVCFTLLATRTVVPTKRSLIYGSCVFITLVIIALILNICIGGHMGVQGFNLFYISPYEAFEVPIVQFAYAHLPYPVYLILYIVLFTLCAALVLSAAHGVHRLLQKRNK